MSYLPRVDLLRCSNNTGAQQGPAVFRQGQQHAWEHSCRGFPSSDQAGPGVVAHLLKGASDVPSSGRQCIESEYRVLHIPCAAFRWRNWADNGSQMLECSVERYGGAASRDDAAEGVGEWGWGESGMSGKQTGHCMYARRRPRGYGEMDVGFASLCRVS